MKIKELIRELQSQDPERTVIMQKDGEGNGYSPLCDFWTGAYRAESTWSGEVGMESLSEDDKESGYSEDDVITDGVPALILCPTN